MNCRNYIKFVLVLITVSLMSGCASTSPIEMTKEIGSTSNTDQAQVNACLAFAERQEDKEMARYERLSSVHLAPALMHRDTMKMVANVFGKDQNICKPGTNMWDAYIVWAKEEGQTKRQYSDDASGVAKFAIVTTGAVKLADSLMGAAGDKIAGDKVTSGRDTSKSNGDLANSGTNNDVHTDISTTRVYSDGDEVNTASLPAEAKEEVIMEEAPLAEAVVETPAVE